MPCEQLLSSTGSEDGKSSMSPSSLSSSIQQHPKESSSVCIQALTIVLALAALFAAIAAEHFRTHKPTVDASSTTRWLLSLGLALSCALVAGPLTHGVLGRQQHQHRGYQIFQPFRGGWRFVVLQILGWTLYASSIIAFIYLIFAVVSRLPVYSGTMATAGFGSVFAQVILFASLRFFESSHNDLVMDFLSFVATAFIYSFPILTVALFVVPYILLSLPVYVSLLLIFITVYATTYNGRPHRTGSRSWSRVRHSMLWKYLEHYFSFRIIADAQLDAKTTYMLGYHPHGIYPYTSVWGTRGPSWTKRFPNLTLDSLGASVLFYLPIMRDVAMWSGARDATRESISCAFQQGHSIILVPGGEREMRENRPESNEIVLITRHKGFIRMALQYGVSLVPVFGFGESQILDNFRAKRMQEFFAKRIFYGMPHLPFGRFYSPIPNAVSLTLAVGDPIPVERVDEAKEKVVDDLHRLYFCKLRELFEKHKNQVAGYENSRIVFPEFGEATELHAAGTMTFKGYTKK